jgi:hypothetical protein
VAEASIDPLTIMEEASVSLAPRQRRSNEAVKMAR